MRGLSTVAVLVVALVGVMLVLLLLLTVLFAFPSDCGCDPESSGALKNEVNQAFAWSILFLGDFLACSISDVSCSPSSIVSPIFLFLLFVSVASKSIANSFSTVSSSNPSFRSITSSSSTNVNNTARQAVPKQPPPASTKVVVQPTVLPPNTPNTAAIPVPANVVSRVPGSPKNYRFSITQNGIVTVPAVNLPAVSLATYSAQQQAQQQQISKPQPVQPVLKAPPQPVQKPAPQPAVSANTNNANNASNVPVVTPKADPKLGGLVFRLQDTVTALAVVQKALEQKKVVPLVPTGPPPTLIAPRPQVVPTNPKALPLTPIQKVAIPANYVTTTAKQNTTTTTNNTSTMNRPTNIRNSADGAKQASRPNMPSPTILKRSSGAGQPVAVVSSQSVQLNAPQPVQARQASSQPQTRVPLAPSPSVSPQPQRTTSPPLRTSTSPPLRTSISPVVYEFQQYTPPTQTPGANPQLYRNYQEQYMRLVQHHGHLAAGGQPSPVNASPVQPHPAVSVSLVQPTHTAVVPNPQYSSSQPNPQAQYFTQPSTQQYAAQYNTQAQYTSHPQQTSSQPSSLRVSVNPMQGTATIHTSQQYPPQQSAVEVPSVNQNSSHYNAYAPQQPYRPPYPQTLPRHFVVDSSAEAQVQYHTAQPTNTAAYDASLVPTQQSQHQQTPQASTTPTYNPPQAMPIVNNNNTQTTPAEPTTAPQVSHVDSKPVITTVVQTPSPSELSSNSNSVSDDDVIITGTNNKAEKPLRRSVALPPRRLVPSSESQSISQTNGDSNNNNNATTSTAQSITSTQPVETSAASTTVAEPMEVEPTQPIQPAAVDSNNVANLATDIVPKASINNVNINNSQVDNTHERDRCMMLSTARFLSRENNGDNNGPQNNNPMYINVPDVDQSEMNRLRPNMGPRRQILRSDEYWSYWSNTSQSQASQESVVPHGQEEQSNRSPEHDTTTLAHSQDDLGHGEQRRYARVQSVPAIQVEQSDQVHAVQRPATNSLARSSEFGLTNFELDEQSYMPPLPGHNNTVATDTTVPSTEVQPYVQPNPVGFSNTNAEGNSKSNSNSTSPRMIGPLDKYFRISPEKVQDTVPAAPQQQTMTNQSHHEPDVITNDSQEDPSARANNNNMMNNNNNVVVNNNNVVNNENANTDASFQYNNSGSYYSSQSDLLVPLNNNNNNNASVNYPQQQQQLYPPSKYTENLRQSHGGTEKPKAGEAPKTQQQRVLLPYIPDGPLVLTRIEPAPAWHGGLLWPGLGTIKQQYMELFIPNDPRIQSIPYIPDLPKLLMARDMSICDSQTMPTGHYCIQLISPVLDKHSLPKAFWDPNYKAFWALKMHYNNLLLCIGPKMIDRKTILCLYITVQGPTPRPITCTLSTVPGDMLNFFRGLNMEHYYHDFQRNGITSLHALCQITREQMETIILSENELNVVLEGLKD